MQVRQVDNLVFLSLDIKNAYNTMARGYMPTEIREFAPELLHRFLWSRIPAVLSRRARCKRLHWLQTRSTLVAVRTVFKTCRLILSPTKCKFLVRPDTIPPDEGLNQFGVERNGIVIMDNLIGTEHYRREQVFKIMMKRSFCSATVSPPGQGTSLVSPRSGVTWTLSWSSMQRSTTTSSPWHSCRPH